MLRCIAPNALGAIALSPIPRAMVWSKPERLQSGYAVRQTIFNCRPTRRVFKIVHFSAILTRSAQRLPHTDANSLTYALHTLHY